ncbi:MAG: DUF2304 domain-containing protein [Bryobacteraceae bacterium]|nr:DUF2304 domain-containing protein [Bryobacteraceae bacterium]
MDRMMTSLMVFSLTIIALVLVSVRREHIRVEYSVSWLTASIVLLILSLRRDLVQWLAATLGIDYPPVAILMVVSFVFLIVFYRFSIRISALKDSNVALAQRIAILEYHLKSTHEQQKTASG